MKFPSPISVREIADRFGARLIGDDSLLASGINEIHKVEEGDITFSDVKKYFQKALDSAATVVLLNEEADCPPGKALLICEQPFEVYDRLVRDHRPFRPLAFQLSESAEIGEGTVIEPGVVIGNEVRIGRNCYIQANAYIGDFTEVGDDVEIQAGAIIGTDAFYFKKHPEGYQKWRSGGKVVIGNDVVIGAGCTIAKGVSGITRIGRGTMLDCQVHIGHGVVIGERCLLAGQVGIGGKTVIGDDVVMYGQVGVAQSLRIGDGVVIGAKSGVSKNLKAGKTYLGTPAEEIGDKYRQLAWLRSNSRRK